MNAMNAVAAPSLDVCQLSLYEGLAHLMNARPDHYRVLGDCDMTAVFSLQRPAAEGGDVHVQLVFSEISCVGVDTVGYDEARLADFRLEGPVVEWTSMFTDIVANGHASGEWTINSLALRGDRISIEGDDPMGLDKFSRFIQTLQDFLDGTSRLESDLAAVLPTR